MHDFQFDSTLTPTYHCRHFHRFSTNTITQGNAIMGSFGEKMQREREMRSITLDEISESTKISARMLRALEEEEFEKLPGGIFNKGFVRAYARYLGLNEEQAVADYLGAEAESELKNREHASQDQAKLSAQMSREIHAVDNLHTIHASADSSPEQQPAQAAGFMMASIILVILLGVGGFVWKYYGNRVFATSADAAQTSSAPIAEPSQPIQATAQPQVLPVVQTPAPEVAKSDDSAKTESPKSDAHKKEEQQAKSDYTTAPEIEKPPVTQSTGANAVKSKFSLEIRATEESWVEVKSDGNVSWQGMLSASSNRSFRATKEMTVKLGNAAGVELSYNGKALPRFSSDARTKTLTFTSDGLTSR
jgi:cytoskeleton protein RodZ